MARLGPAGKISGKGPVWRIDGAGTAVDHLKVRLLELVCADGAPFLHYDEDPPSQPELASVSVLEPGVFRLPTAIHGRALLEWLALGNWLLYIAPRRLTASMDLCRSSDDQVVAFLEHSGAKVVIDSFHDDVSWVVAVARRAAPGPTTGTIRLRSVERADLPVFFFHQADAEAVRLAAVPARSRGEFDAHWERIRDDPTVWARTVVLDVQVVGNVLCWTAGDERLIGYWIGRQHWGRGIATQAVRLLLAEVAERPLVARVATHNAGSIRVLQKHGFVVEREERSSVRGVEAAELVMVLR